MTSTVTSALASCGERLARAWSAFIDPHYGQVVNQETAKERRQRLKREEEEKKKKEEEQEGKLTVSPNMMKLITLIVLLVSDFDMLFTICSLVSYLTAGGIFLLFVAIIGWFFVIYIGGCIMAARESTKFIERFTEKVRLNEINGISLEDLTEALESKRIFWMGTNFEATKKRKASAQALRLLTPETVTAQELKIADVEQALKEAEMNGLEELMMPGDPKHGKKLIGSVNKRLIEAKAAQGVTAAPQAQLKRAATARFTLPPGGVPEGAEGGAAGEVAEPHYISQATRPRSRDEVRGRAANVNHTDEGVGGEDEEGNPDEDMQKKVFEEELAVAQAANDPLLARKIQMAQMKHLDSYKIPAKLCDEQGKVIDPIRGLFMICEAKGILHSYHQASRQFARRVVKPSHSTPFYRLMEYGWQPSVRCLLTLDRQRPPPTPLSARQRPPTPPQRPPVPIPNASSSMAGCFPYAARWPVSRQSAAQYTTPTPPTL